MADFRMPSLGADMDAGTLVEWRVAPGDRVARGDIVAVVETEKAAVEIEIFTTGVIETIVVPVGEKVPVGTVIATVRAEGEQSEERAAPAPAVEPRKRARVSPAARKLARELGVDPATVHGTGPRGAVTRADVEAAAGTPAETADPRAAMRRAIAAAMSRANREIPHYYLATTVDMAPLLAFLADHNASVPAADRWLAGALYVKAVAVAAHRVPELNGHFRDDVFQPSEVVHVGMAVSLRSGGVVAPAIHDADDKDLADIMADLRDVVARARAGSLRSSELSDATITITSLGDRGCEQVYGIINPPQVAMVGFGSIVERPWVVGGAVVPRPVVNVSLSADHRVSDGHRGGRFLAAVERLLQCPEEL